MTLSTIYCLKLQTLFLCFLTSCISLFSQNIGKISMSFCLRGTASILRLNEDIKIGWELWNGHSAVSIMIKVL